MGVNLNTLGCVMAPLELLPMPEIVSEDDLYFSMNPERFWIKGWVANRKAHVTLLYGLLLNQMNIKDSHIREVLGGWGLPSVEVDYVDTFDSPYDDEDYYCVVAHLLPKPNLLEGHKRLSLLPHINTFGDYKAHMTLGYIKKDPKLRMELLNSLRDWKWKRIDVTGDIIISRK